MKRLSLPLRISLGLVCLTVSLLLVALALGLVPDREGAVLQGRKALCEEMAIQFSFCAQQGDLATVRATIAAVLERNPEILSAAVRRADGTTWVEVGDHTAHWGDVPTTHSTPTHVQVPIALKDRLWGTLQLRFQPTASAGLWGLGQYPGLRLVAFVALASLVGFFFYLGLVFRQINVSPSDAVPRRVRTTLNTLAEGVVVLDRDQRIALANQAFADLVGQSPSSLQGRCVAELPWTQPSGDTAPADYPWARALGHGTVQTGAVLALQAGDQRARTLSVNSAPILADDGTQRGALATFDNLTPIERKNAHLRKLLQRLKQSRTIIRQQNLELKAQATRDPLTGCLNRRAFMQELEGHWTAAQRYGQALGCVLVDIDHFKSVNDTYGHSSGDRVLQHVAEALKRAVRKSDLVCRYGGEEFCVLLPHIDLEGTQQAAERFRQAIALQECAGIAVTASLGVSAFGLGAREPHELLDQADKALYAAKRGGRNRVVRWDEMPAAAPERRDAPALPAAPFHVAIPFHAVTALVAALAYRHTDTAEHSRRVADLCVATANGLLSQSECYVLEVAAMLHDIGKLGVPDAVLLKPGPLTEAEWKVIRTHEGIGEEIITSSFNCEQLSGIITSHHCWFGGSPHDPDLPRGTAIPLGARILTIADAFDAMVSDRVYRKGRSHDEAFAELRRCAGVQFDPELVERFIAVVQARDENRTPPALAMSKQMALEIGLHIEKLAIALDGQDHHSLAAMASHLNATAAAYGVTPIAEAAAQLRQAVEAQPDPVHIAQQTIELLELCRQTYSCYLPQCDRAAEPVAVG